MNSPFKNLDTFQIIGFLLSAAISVGSWLSGESASDSLVLGFILATFTQLFDQQKRLSDTEERLIQANALGLEVGNDDL